VTDLRDLYAVNQSVTLEFRKWDDRLHYFWNAGVLEVFADRVLVASRAGTVFHHVTRGRTITLEHDARLAFWQGRWYSGGPDLEPRRDTDLEPRSERVLEYYINIGTPPEFRADRIVVVDLELDLKARPDLTLEEFDWDEFLEAKSRFAYPAWLERRVRLAAQEVRDHFSRAEWPCLAPQRSGADFAWLQRLPDDP
jgi:hypothetical protein